MKRTMLAVMTTAALTVASWQVCAKTTPITSAQFEDQATLAVDWDQHSGEYRALAYQAFNTARMAYDALPKSEIKKAVVVDLDETMIDNSAYAAWRIKEGKGFSSKTWHQWELAGKATAYSLR